MNYDRDTLIFEYLKSHTLATVADLIAYTGASGSTLRRDLTRLSNEGRVHRVHGSVTLPDAVRQPTTKEKQERNHQAKLRIAAYAATLISPGKSLVLDAGTTTIEVARLLRDMQLRVVTPDLNIGLLLSGFDSVMVSVTGGTVDTSSQSCIGDLARSMISRVHPDYVFVSCNAWDLGMGVTAPTTEKAALKTCLMGLGGRCVLVADSSKYGQKQLFEVGALKGFDMVITDTDLNPEAAAAIGQAGIDLHLV